MAKELIYELLPKVAQDIGVIGKDSKNQQQGYRYRGIESIMDACHVALCKHGVTMLPRVVSMSREDRKTSRGATMACTVLTVEYLFAAKDGSTVSCSVIGEGMDMGDKSANKAMSQAFKYAAGQVFSIPFDNIDAEVESPTYPAKRTPEATTDAQVTKAPTPEEGRNIAAELNTIIDLCKETGAGNREEILALIGGLAGKKIKATQELNADDRAKVLASLRERKANRG